MMSSNEMTAILNTFIDHICYNEVYSRPLDINTYDVVIDLDHLTKPEEIVFTLSSPNDPEPTEEDVEIPTQEKINNRLTEMIQKNSLPNRKKLLLKLVEARYSQRQYFLICRSDFGNTLNNQIDIFKQGETSRR